MRATITEGELSRNGRATIPEGEAGHSTNLEGKDVGERSSIEWTDATWSPVTGCTKVSPGCANCYIERTPPFRKEGRRFVNGEIPVRLHPDRLEQPLRWRKPRMVFVVSMGDLFHEDVPDDFIDSVMVTMQQAFWHTFQVLTKRPERMRHWSFHNMPNVWLGVSVENQRWAEERIPLLLETPATVRFLSCEPLLGPLDLRPWLQKPKAGPETLRPEAMQELEEIGRLAFPSIDWAIAGGESGGPEDRRLVERCDHFSVEICRSDGMLTDGSHPCNGTGWRPKPEALEWIRSIREQCREAQVPYFLKQWGGPRHDSGGRVLDGRTWDEMPAWRRTWSWPKE